MTILDIKLNISEEVLEYLQREAKNRNISLDTVVSDVLADYFDDPGEEEILATIRESMQEALAGNVRPVDEVIAELKEEFDFDANES